MTEFYAPVEYTVKKGAPIPKDYDAYKLTRMLRVEGKVLMRQIVTGAASGWGRLEKIEGNTVAFNQLARTPFDMSNWSSSSGATFTKSFDSATNTLSLTSSVNGFISPYFTCPFIPNEHICMIHAEIMVSFPLQSTVSMWFRPGQSGAVRPSISNIPQNEFVTLKGRCKVMNGSDTTQTNFPLDYSVYTTTSGVSAPAGSTISFRNVMVVDCTAIFGAGNEPTTVADFEAWMAQNGLPSVAAYNAGELLSMKMQSVKSVGFNQWDEDWERGGISNGLPVNNSFQIRSKNFLPILSNQDYCYTGYNYIWIYYYDADKNWIGPSADYKSNDVLYIIKTTPQNAKYIKFKYGYSDSPATTYNHDICINLSDPAKNGTYKPYMTDSADIDVTTITGINTSTNVREVMFTDGMNSTADGDVDVIDLTSDTAERATYLIPSTYQELEYLESDQNAYINLNIYATVDMVVRLRYSNNDNGWIFGRTAGASGRWGLGVSTFYSDNQTVSFTATTEMSLECDFGRGVTIDSVDYDFSGTPVNPSNNVMYLFSANGSTAYPRGKIYFFDVYESGVLMMRLIPVRRISDSVLGMYDVVTDTLLTNAGTGSFIAGADVYKAHALDTPITYTDLQDANGNPLKTKYRIESGGTEQVLPANNSTPTTTAPKITSLYTKA